MSEEGKEGQYTLKDLPPEVRPCERLARDGERALSDAELLAMPADAANLLVSKMRYLDHKHLKVILLNTRSMVMNVETVSVKTLHALLAHPRECFKESVRQSAAAVLFVRNHPSGAPIPSPEDITLTRPLSGSGTVVGQRGA